MPPSPTLSVVDIAERVTRTPARLGRTRLVCIDGPAGSGKTSLAADLQAGLEAAAVLHMDDIYRGWETEFDEVRGRLREQVVEPLAHGRAASYQRYDWHAGRFDAWVELPPPAVLLLEGVGAGAAGLEPVRSLLVWVEADRDERIRRGVARDGVDVLPLWLAWMEHEEVEHARQHTRERADLRLRGNGPQNAPDGGYAVLP